MPSVRIGFFLVFLIASGLGKTTVHREVSPEPKQDASDLETGRRRISAFGQPGLPGKFPTAPLENDLESVPAPDDDLEESSNDDDERNEEIEGRRIPDEGFFAGRRFQNEDERNVETDTEDIAEIDNEIGRGKGQELGNIPAEVFLEINEESESKDATNDGSPEEGDDGDSHEDEGSDAHPEGEEYDEASSNAEENHRYGSIVNHPLFIFRRLFKYFTMFEKIFENFFRRAMDELPLQNGTYENTTEEDVAIDGRLFHAITTLIKDRAKNNTLYIETLSSLPDSNASQVSKEENL